MKKLLFILFLQLFAFSAIAQINTERQEERAKQKVENRVDQKVDQAVDNALNKIEGLFKKKPKKQKEEEVEVEERSVDEMNDQEMPVEEEEISEEEIQQKLDDFWGNDEEEEDYVPMENGFTGSFTMIMERLKNGKPDKNGAVNIEMHFDKTKTGMVMDTKDGKTAKIIFDLSDNSMTMITDEKGKTSGFKMRRPKIKKLMEDALDDTDIQKTGEMRTIDGYRCEKYIVTNTEDDYVTTAWITKDVDIDWRKVAESMAMGKLKAGGYSDWEGFNIESESVHNGGKETYKTRTKNIKLGSVDKSVFDTSGVEIISMPGFN